jgi:4-hydroxy-3-methylbut-2-enyl diphosphate reductase
MRVLLANPRGFCAGVNMAIDALEKAIELFGTPIYVYHEIVHNKYVVDRFRGKGAEFVDDLSLVPLGATLLFSAHGVSPEIRRQARDRRLRTIDATCPLVTKVHLEAVRFAREGFTIILIGHEGHDEVVGTLGEAPHHIQLVENVEDVERLEVPDKTKIAYLTQTTLSIDDAAKIIAALQARFPDIVGPTKDDICYATQNRQEAVKELAGQADVVLVLGSQNSSNSQRLREIAIGEGKRAYLIDGIDEIRAEWLNPSDVVLITAGASAPETVVHECVAYLQREFQADVEHRTVREEHVSFPMPKELRGYVDELVDLSLEPASAAPRSQ